MPRQIISDPAHPDFPHGTSTGRNRGCQPETCPATPNCAQVRYREQIRSRMVTARGLPGRVDAGPTLRHAEALIAAVPGASRKGVCEAAGVSGTTLVRAQQTRRLARSSVFAILSLTPDQVRAHYEKIGTSTTRQRRIYASADPASVPTYRLRHKMRTMQALGYPMRWQEQQVGNTGLVTLMVRNQALVSGVAYAAIEALAERIGNQAPDPERDGLTVQGIARAKAAAARDGFFPPAAYDEEGNLDLRHFPGHPWALADDDCGRILDCLHDQLVPISEEGPAAVSAQYGLEERRLARIRAKLDVHFEGHHRPGDPFHLTEDSLAPAERFRALIAAERSADDGGDPVLFCLRHGLTSPNGNNVLTADHPAVAVWKAELAALHDEVARLTPPTPTPLTLQEAA